jgi:ABC-type multidrug transport system fused ATPase/permease subunit
MCSTTEGHSVLVRVQPGIGADTGTNADAWTLRSLFVAYRWRIMFTYGLLNLENLVHLAQPWVLGLAINDLIGSSYFGLVLFAAQYLAYVALSAWRRSYDARAFTGIYADLASRVVLRQRHQGVEISQVVTRSALSREVVDFFERDIPVVFQALYAVAGALVMLAVCDVVLVPCCLALLLPVAYFSIWGGRKSLTLNIGLNDELEREVDVIHRARRDEVHDHYRSVAGWRVRLADWQALNFAGTELFVVGLLAAALLRCCTADSPDLGRVFAVFGYVLMFVGSLANLPMLVQQVSRLRDINRRIGAQRSHII